MARFMRFTRDGFMARIVVAGVSPNLLFSLLTGLILPLGCAAAAGPSGEQVAAGLAEFSRQGGNLTVNQLTDTTYGGSLGGAVSLIKEGAGSLTLGGASTTSGSVAVNGGTLIVDGTLSGSLVSVNGGTLKGIGTLANLTGNAGGTIAPGDSAGVLAVANDFGLQAGAHLTLELNGLIAGTQYDQLTVGGNVTLGGDLAGSTLGFSPLTAINRSNVAALGLAWSLPLGTGSNAIAPLVHDGVLFVHSSNTVSAIDGRNGDVIWSFFKVLVFAVAIILIHCFFGYTAFGGPAGVGVAVGRAVRTAIVTVTLFDFFLSLAIWGSTTSVRLAG